MLGRKLHSGTFKNKGKSGWTGTSSFVLEVPLCNLRPGIIYSFLCDRIVQRAYRPAAVYAPITFEEIVIVMINDDIRSVAPSQPDIISLPTGL